MRRDRHERPLFHSTVPQHAGLRSSHVDFLLRFVIDRSTAPAQSVSARIDALEQTLVALTRQWRSTAALAVTRELRLSNDTLAMLLSWLEGSEAPDEKALERLGVMASGAVTDESVPSGWVRIQFV